MTKDAIKSTVIKAILEIAPDIEEDEIELNENIQRSLEIDSFDFLKILTQIDRETGVSVPEVDYAKVDTIENMAEYILGHL